MLEIYLLSLATLFATVSPVSIATVFAVLTIGYRSEDIRKMAIRATVIGTSLLLLFALTGEWLLTKFGISLYALKAGGGILLLLIGIEMVFARSKGASSATKEEEEEATQSDDISVFPLATPMIAGPGSIGVSILMMSSQSELANKAIVILSLFSISLITLLMLFIAPQIKRVLGVTGMNVVERIFGVLLTAMAMQFLFDGIKASGILS